MRCMIPSVTHYQSCCNKCKNLVPETYADVCSLIGRLCLKVSWYKKVASNRAAFCSVQFSGTVQVSGACVISFSNMLKVITITRHLVCINHRSEAKLWWVKTMNKDGCVWCFFVDAAIELLRARSKLFAFNSNNAVLQFLLDVIMSALTITTISLDRLWTLSYKKRHPAKLYASLVGFHPC